MMDIEVIRVGAIYQDNTVTTNSYVVDAVLRVRAGSSVEALSALVDLLALGVDE